MKPAPFDYARPLDLAGALALCARSDAAVRLLAGGQSLGPMLNLRLVQPDLLVDVTGVPELLRAEPDDDGLVLGACVTHADIEDGRVPDVTGGALPAVAGGIAYRAVRNRGTVGGSLAHADPAADWITALSALGAEVTIRSADGVRRLQVGRFIVGAFETAMQAGEILEAVRIPRLSRRARWGYWKFCRKAGEFAHAIGAVLWDPERSVCRAAIGAIDAPPIVLEDARDLFGGRPDGRLVDSYVPAVAAKLLDGRGLRDAYDRRVHLAALQRAVERADAA
jgi:carbon-monoxide dehydrogenase medium subunit